MEEQSVDVYIYSEKIYGRVKSLGAFASMVVYEKDGIRHEELLENEDFEVIG